MAGKQAGEPILKKPLLPADDVILAAIQSGHDFQKGAPPTQLQN